MKKHKRLFIIKYKKYKGLNLAACIYDDIPRAILLPIFQLKTKHKLIILDF